MIIPLDKINNPLGLASSAASDCLYVNDFNSSCIWKITLYDHQVTKWICYLRRLMRKTVSKEGQVVVLQLDETSKKQFLEIYGSDAIFIRRVNLSNGIFTLKAILKPDGQLIIVELLSEDGNILIGNYSSYN